MSNDTKKLVNSLIKFANKENKIDRMDMRRLARLVKKGEIKEAYKFW